MMDTLARRQRSQAGRAWQALTLGLLLLALGLRLYYAVEAAAFVDEPTTLLVAQSIATSGLPILPSGLFYGNDLPFSYLAGAVMALTGAGAADSLLVVRLLTITAAITTILIVSVAGRRFFGPWVGLWAALLVALDPEALVWGARARAYGVLGLFSFGGLALFYAGVAHGKERPAMRRAGLALLTVALFVHPEAALLLPAVAAATVLVKGTRWWLGGTRSIELAAAFAAAAGRYGLQLALARGLIGGFQTVAGSRPPVEIAVRPLAALHEIAPFFVGAGRLPWTILAMVATVAAGWSWWTGHRGERTRAALFFSTCLWLVPAGMLLLFGQTYQSPRYLIFVIPILALCAAVGLSWVLARLIDPIKSPGKSLASVAIVSLVLLAGYLPGGLAAAGSREKGFVAAMAYVSGAWREGDRVATVAPATCHLYLGRCDYFALGIDYEEFVYRDANGQVVDRWLGSPLVRTAGDLDALLEHEGRLWLIVDEGRLRTRFNSVFAQAVWQEMEPVLRTDDVLVFRSPEEEPPAVVHDVDALFDESIALVAYALPDHDRGAADTAWGQIVAAPGETVPLVLYWQAVSPVPHESVVFVHLLGADGERYAQGDGPPLGGVQPMTHWTPGETLPDRRALELPADLPPGRYRLVAGLYDRDSGRRPIAGDGAAQVQDNAVILDYVNIVGGDVILPSPEVPVHALFEGEGDRIELLGYGLSADSVQAGSELSLTLYWQADGPISAAYTTFVHLLGTDGEIRSQDDGPPLNGFYPTSFWDPGEIVVDRRVVAVDPGVAPGTYRLVVGLYILDPPRRLQTGEGDRVMLTQVQVTE